jgi:hypothetical protein
VPSCRRWRTYLPETLVEATCLPMKYGQHTYTTQYACFGPPSERDTYATLQKF